MATFEISPSLRERVDAGFEWLDENLPDWRQYVDRRTLDMALYDDCILGQYHMARYGEADFGKIVHAHFGGNWDRAVELGFMSVDFGYEELTAAWQQKFDDEKKAT